MIISVCENYRIFRFLKIQIYAENSVQAEITLKKLTLDLMTNLLHQSHYFIVACRGALCESNKFNIRMLCYMYFMCVILLYH